MHPDRTAHAAPRDLFARPAAGAPRQPGFARVVSRVLHAWMEGWTWYARQGFAPAAVEPVFPFRVRGGARPARHASARRWVTPSVPRSVSLLRDCATGAGCA
jgi:hypothetical protein